MRHSLRSLGFLLTLAVVVAASGVLWASPITRAATECDGPQHPKSAAGLMPPACGLDPDAPAPKMLAAAASFLGAPINTRVGSWAQLVAAADLNNDQVDEAAVATADYFDSINDWHVHLLKQFASMFELIQKVPTGKYAEAITPIDANHDDLMDLVVAGEDGVLLITQAFTGTLPLSEPIEVLTGELVDALAVGDINGDLHPDLLAVVPEADTILAWTSSPTGLDVYELDIDYPTDGYSALAVGDLNNDGFDDLAALRGSGYAENSVVVFLQDNGSFLPSFKRTPQTGGYLPHSLTVGDTNGDGLDDLVVTAGGNTPAAYLNVFPQVVTDATTIPPTSSLAQHPVVYDAYHLPGAVQIGDLNHDGREDVAVANDAWRTIGVYTQAADKTLNPYDFAEIPYSSRYRPNALALGDFDGNGGLDVAVVGRDPGLTVLPNTGTAPTATISTPPDAAAIAPGTLVVTGTTTAGTTAVEVRIKGLTGWLPATLTGTTWQVSINDIPAIGRSWWIEARAIAGDSYQAPVARHRVHVHGRVTDDILVLYTFEEGSGESVKDVGGFEEPLDLVIKDPSAVQWGEGRLVVTDTTVIASPDAATKVYEALQDTNEVTIEAWVIPANTTQDGPARIVTLSHNACDVNLSLGQGLWGNRPSDMYSVSLNTRRSRHKSTNWLTTPDGSLTTTLTHVLVTHEANGKTRIYLNGVEVSEEWLEGDFSKWDSRYPLALANDIKASHPWLGTFDLVALYQRALTPEEVLQNYQAGSGSTLLIPTNDNPVVNDLSIDDRANSTTDRRVSLNIRASSPIQDRTIQAVRVKEYVIDQATGHWFEVRESGWRDYGDYEDHHEDRGEQEDDEDGEDEQTSMTMHWKLADVAGVHYLQVWAKDDQGLVSRFPYQAFINYVPEQDTLDEGQGRVYRYALSAGESLTARVDPVSGDPDLAAWAPVDTEQQPWISNLREQADIVTFVAEVEGIYQVEVTGYTAATYGLTVEVTPAQETEEEEVRADTPTGGLDADKVVRGEPLVSLDNEPVFVQPNALTQVFLPMVVR